jgi:GH15 family glucan-1,4-alpha-glucosidase
MTTFDFTPPASADLRRLAASSVELIERHQDGGGAFPASPTFPVYRYSWFRDGAFIADALSRYGRIEPAERFFDWCNSVLVVRRGRVATLLDARANGREIRDSELLPCRFRLDGSEDDSEWWNFQLDGYGTWLWAAGAHAARHGLSCDRWQEGFELSARYLTGFWDVPCYDWWEEHRGERHTSTLAAIVGGLEAAASSGVLQPQTCADAAAAAAAARAAILADGTIDGRFAKWLGGSALDASLLSCSTPFRVVDPRDPRMTATVAGLEESLAHGGVHRYLDDTYYGGGEWVLLAALLGWHYLEAGRRDDALAQLAWVAGCASPAGELPEQVDGHLLAPEREAEWVERWGSSARPLLWSHAMFVTLAVELGVVGEEPA